MGQESSNGTSVHGHRRARGIIRHMTVSRVRWVLAQLGRKPGGSQALSQILDPADLPGRGWTVMDQRTWRTGSDPTTDWQRRAKAAACITAWRSFEQTGAKRGLWIQATPVVDSADAASALSQLPERMLRNLRANVRVVEEREVPPPAPLTSEIAWAWEQRAEGKIGESISLTLILASGRNVITVAGSGLDKSWTWGEMRDLAQCQASRLPV
jgi:hypothetical protein